MTLTILRSTAQVFCRVSFTWICLMIFLMIILGSWICGKGTTEAKCHSYHIISRIHTINMILHCWCGHLVEVMFFSFLHSKFTLFLSFCPSSHTVPFGRKSLCGVHTKGVGSYMSLLGGWRTYLNYYFFKKNKLFIYLFLAALGLCCCTWAFSSCGERGLLFIVVHRLLIAVASLVVVHGF